MKKLLLLFALVMPCLTMAQTSEDDFKKRLLAMETRQQEMEFRINRAVNMHVAGSAITLAGLAVAGVGVAILNSGDTDNGNPTLLAGSILTATGATIHWLGFTRLKSRKGR